MNEMFPSIKQDHIWSNLKKGLDAISEMTDTVPRNDRDKWLFGATRPTNADFALCSSFIWFEKAGPPDGWTKVKGWHGGRWERLYEECRQYMAIH